MTPITLEIFVPADSPVYMTSTSVLILRLAHRGSLAPWMQHPLNACVAEPEKIPTSVAV